VKFSVPTTVYGDAGLLFILKIVMRSRFWLALVMNTNGPATLSATHTPTGSLYIS